MTVVKLIARVPARPKKPLPAWNDDALMMLSSRTIAMINTKNMDCGCPVVCCKANDHREWTFGSSGDSVIGQRKGLFHFFSLRLEQRREVGILFSCAL